MRPTTLTFAPLYLAPLPAGRFFCRPDGCPKYGTSLLRCILQCKAFLICNDKFSLLANQAQGTWPATWRSGERARFGAQPERERRPLTWPCRRRKGIAACPLASPVSAPDLARSPLKGTPRAHLALYTARMSLCASCEKSAAWRVASSADSRLAAVLTS